MTPTQAAELRVRWKQQAHAVTCEHVTLELEWSDGKYLPGHYICIVCGENFAART